MAEEFLKWAEENKKDKNDRGRYENYLKKSLGDKRLIEVSPIDLERIKSAMNQRGLSPGTVKHALTLVRSIFNKATSWGRFKGVNPVKMVKLPTLNNQRQRFLSHEEAQLLLDELKKGSQTIYEISLVSLLSGLRAGEIHNLRGRDLDFENMVIHVADPKNKNSRKTFMTEEVKSVLQGRIGDDPNKFVFAPRIHELDHIKRVSGFFQRTANELFNEGIEDRRQRVVFHTLRHSFGSWLAIQGTPILTIKELMGHKTLNMTLRYAHLSPSPQKDAVAALQAGFNQGRNGKEEKVNLQAVS
jgi:integrase